MTNVVQANNEIEANSSESVDNDVGLTMTAPSTDENYINKDDDDDAFVTRVHYSAAASSPPQNGVDNQITFTVDVPSSAPEILTTPSQHDDDGEGPAPPPLPSSLPPPPPPTTVTGPDAVPRPQSLPLSDNPATLVMGGLSPGVGPVLPPPSPYAVPEAGVTTSPTTELIVPSPVPPPPPSFVGDDDETAVVAERPSRQNEDVLVVNSPFSDNVKETGPSSLAVKQPNITENSTSDVNVVTSELPVSQPPPQQQQTSGQKSSASEFSSYLSLIGVHGFGGNRRQVATALRSIVVAGTGQPPETGNNLDDRPVNDDGGKQDHSATIDIGSSSGDSCSGSNQTDSAGVVSDLQNSCTEQNHDRLSAAAAAESRETEDDDKTSAAVEMTTNDLVSSVQTQQGWLFL